MEQAKFSLTDLPKLGPLANLVGEWRGDKGDDTAPSDDRGTEKNLFREEFVFKPFGPSDNHEQVLWGVSYVRTAWRLGEDSPFHEQVGYWFWDSATEDVMHAFLIPRGMTTFAGGKSSPQARTLQVTATLGSPTFGICSNPFLDREFKTLRYDGQLSFLDANTLSYEEDTQIQMKGRPDLFHHIDKNTLKRIL